MQDRELLELAAKAADIDVDWRNNPDECGIECQARVINGVFQDWWMPLDDDGDAMRVAVDLQMDVLQDERSISIKKWCEVRCESIFLAEQPIESRRSIATRRAIVRAAAEIGKQMK